MTWAGFGNLLLYWLVKTAMWGYYFAWALPRFAYLRVTRQIPRLPPTPLGTRLPTTMRVRVWCTVCTHTLAEGSVRCPDHPEAEVMIMLRDTGGNDATR